MVEQQNGYCILIALPWSTWDQENCDEKEELEASFSKVIVKQF